MHAVLVPTRAKGYVGARDGVHISGPDALHKLVQDLQRPWSSGALTADEFLARDAYCPLPTLVQAARELFLEGNIRPIHRARACTDPAVEEISRIAHEAAATRTRHLILVTGVPGSGKTLVGLRAVHWTGLDDLAVERAGGKPTAPGIFLSGNGPLVQVLQYELKADGGGGKTFVRDVKNYVKQYLGDKAAIPPSTSSSTMRRSAPGTWRRWRPSMLCRESCAEPEAFVEFGERIPEWCVLVGLIGSGQEIHIGEEAGLGQWRQALAAAGRPDGWTIHAPQRVLDEFFAGPDERGCVLPCGLDPGPQLDLKVELRFHFCSDLDAWVDGLLADDRGWSGEICADKARRHRPSVGR